jgi:TolB-like protein
MINLKKTGLTLSIFALLATTAYAEHQTFTFNINSNSIQNKVVPQSITIDNNTQSIKDLAKSNTVNKYDDLDSTIKDLAQRLLNSSRINQRHLDEIAITSFVDLHQFTKTSHFGRTISESFFDELFTRGFNITDFRGQEDLTINSNGEYFLTRDSQLLNKVVKNSYILVGTYSKFEDSILINARIINNTSGRIVASAKSYYNSTDCKLLENCKKKRRINIVSHDDYVIRKIASTPTNYISNKTTQASAICKTTKSRKLRYRSRKTNELSLIN